MVRKLVLALCTFLAVVVAGAATDAIQWRAADGRCGLDDPDVELPENDGRFLARDGLVVRCYLTVGGRVVGEMPRH
jgi:hypothetical protein